jgi:uncharacterized protein (TIGR02246 family)
MRWFAGIAIATSLIVMPAIAHTENASIDTKADVQKIATQWLDAYNKHDAATIAALYAPDAFMSVTPWTATGRPAIQEALTKEFAAGMKMTAINVDESQRLGDWQFELGTWSAEMKGPDGKTMPINGHWLIVATCQGQDCLIASHVSNTDMPPPK